MPKEIANLISGRATALPCPGFAGGSYVSMNEDTIDRNLVGRAGVKTIKVLSVMGSDKNPKFRKAKSP